MPRRLGVMFLAAAVFMMNAYCACTQAAGAAAGSHDRREVERPAHGGCHGHGDPSEPQRGEEHHDCGHCTGVFADASPHKTTPADPFASPLIAFMITGPDVAAVAPCSGHRVDHGGLSPPIPPPTLLNLFCSFTT